MSILVFGSINMDLVARTPKLPSPGETLIGHQFETVPGGKGANQAVAAARLGVPTQMVGRVGGDRFGTELLESLQAAEVEIDRIFVDQSVSSGVAVIAVDDASENHIIVIPGANGQVSTEDVERLSEVLSQNQVLLLQLEIPIAAVTAAAQAAQSAGVTVILDPAPAQTNLPDSLYRAIDILTPNQVEASQLVGFPVTDVESAAKAATALQQRGANTVIIKLGKQGALCATPAHPFLVPAFEVKAIDTVAAGDAFNGGLAAALAEGLPLAEAVTWGCAVAALSVMKPGAQPSMPDRTEVEQFLQQMGDRTPSSL
jgi:ribokinase